MSGALCGLREAVAGQLRRGGLPAVAAMEGRRAGRWRETVAAVSLSRVACAPGGFQDYRGVWTDPDSGKKREVYGRQAEITLTLDVYAPREGGESACQRGAETAAELLMCQGAAGLAALELRWGPVEFREELGMYRLPVSCRCGAWLTARTDGETGVFTDFEVKGRTI